LTPSQVRYQAALRPEKLYIPIITELGDLAREMFEKHRKFQSYTGNNYTKTAIIYRDLALSFGFVYIDSVQITILMRKVRYLMKEYIRETPLFSLCGLNCCLCPRFRTTGSSRCPGCGGEDFYEKHPTCGIISCGQRHDGVEYCFQCKEYPCNRYTGPNEKDSFITYRHVPMDMNTAKDTGLEKYLEQLSKKSYILDILLDEWDNGRLKSYFCLAVNLLPLSDLELAMSELSQREQLQGEDPAANATSDSALKGKIAKEYFDTLAAESGISLQLRK
jgi:hypothetical protein